MKKCFEEHRKEMLELGEVLVDYNFPKSPIELDEFIGVLKEREICFDGYSVIFNYNRSEYQNFRLDMLQIKGKYFPYLPFGLICKICKKFFDKKEFNDFITYAEFYKFDKKVYCWALWSDLDGGPILPETKKPLSRRDFEGFDFYQLPPNEIRFM